MTPCNNSCARSGVNPGTSAFSSGGGGILSTQVTSTRSPRGVSPSLPLSSSTPLGSSAVSSGYSSFFPSLDGWPSLCRLASLRGGWGCRVLSSPFHLPIPLLYPSHLPPCWLHPPCPLAPRISWACCGRSGVWPLYGPPPGGKLIIWPRWPGSALRASPSPLMGKVRLTLRASS